MVPMKTVNLIAKINEYKGKQELYKRQAPRILVTLRDVPMHFDIPSKDDITFLKNG